MLLFLCSGWDKGGFLEALESVLRSDTHSASFCTVINLGQPFASCPRQTSRVTDLGDLLDIEFTLDSTWSS